MNKNIYVEFILSKLITFIVACHLFRCNKKKYKKNKDGLVNLVPRSAKQASLKHADHFYKTNILKPTKRMDHAIPTSGFQLHLANFFALQTTVKLVYQHGKFSIYIYPWVYHVIVEHYTQQWNSMWHTFYENLIIYNLV